MVFHYEASDLVRNAGLMLPLVPGALERSGAKALFAADSRSRGPYSHYTGTIPTDECRRNSLED